MGLFDRQMAPAGHIFVALLAAVSLAAGFRWGRDMGHRRLTNRQVGLRLMLLAFSPPTTVRVLTQIHWTVQSQCI
jgi:hypothetical protein